jgi:hypothetical protein
MAPMIAETSSSLKRPRVPSIGEAELDQSLVKKSKELDSETLKLTIKDLKDFPDILDVVNKAKGYFRSQALIRQPYPIGPQKLSLADEAHSHSGPSAIPRPADSGTPPDKSRVLKIVREVPRYSFD